MRGDPDQINRACAEQASAARDKFSDERESYRAESEEDARLARFRPDAGETDPSLGITDEERLAFQAGLKIGERTERRRILAAIDGLIVACCVDGATPESKARAGALAAVRGEVAPK